MSTDTLLFRLIAESTLGIVRGFREGNSEIETKTKSDSTLVTRADIAVQEKIISLLRTAYPSMEILAEEGPCNDCIGKIDDGNFWIIDPIDGTAEFIKKEGREFCIVIARFERFFPTAALLIAPELGINRQPIVITISNELGLTINGSVKAAQKPNSPLAKISATRSRGTTRRYFEEFFLAKGVEIKDRTTSQSLDQIRLALDLSLYSDLHLASFDLFVREKQKVWDGVVGLALSNILGFSAIDWEGNSLLPIKREALSAPFELPCVAIGSNTSTGEFLLSLS